MDAVQRYLKEHTQIDWKAISPLYLRYKTLNNPFGQFCVFAPGDWIRKDPYARFYIPAHRKNLHHPGAFLKELNREKKSFVGVIPWVKIDLNKFPKLEAVSPISPIMIAEYTLEFVGELKFRRIGSVNPIVIGNHFRNIAYEAKVQCGEYLSELTPELNLSERRFSLSLSNINFTGETELKIYPDEKIEASFFPETSNIKIKKNGWEIIGKLGYRLTGSLRQKPKDDSKVMLNTPDFTIKTLSFKEILRRDARAIKSLVVFVKELSEIPAPPSSALAPPIILQESLLI